MTAARPRKHSRPTGERTKEQVDLRKYNEPQNQEKYRDPNRLGVNLPADVPMYMSCFRLMEGLEDAEDGRPITGLRGWTVQLDAWSFGVKIFVRVTRDGNLSLFAEDADGREKLVEWEK